MVWKFTWRRKWHPVLVLLPGKSHRQRDLSEGVETDCAEKRTDRQRGAQTDRTPEATVHGAAKELGLT